VRNTCNSHPRVRLPAAALLISALAAALAGCTGTSISVPDSTIKWRAEPGSCMKVAGNGEITIREGSVRAHDFTWANSEIQFRIFDPGASMFLVAFCDDTFAQTRRSNAKVWFEIDRNRNVPLNQSGGIRNLDRVHELWLSGDQDLIQKGRRALGGHVSSEVGPLGFQEARLMGIFSENFRIGRWNEVRIRVREGIITVWVNGEEGRSVPTDARLNGPFGFEIISGQLKLADIRLAPLYEGGAGWQEKPSQ